jgi:hypothetical protein
MITRTCILLFRNYHVGELSSLVSVVMRLGGWLGNCVISGGTEIVVLIIIQTGSGVHQPSLLHTGGPVMVVSQWVCRINHLFLSSAVVKNFWGHTTCFMYCGTWNTGTTFMLVTVTVTCRIMMWWLYGDRTTKQKQVLKWINRWYHNINW